MLKKTITYKTFDGETVTDDFYFNLTKAELLELELSEKGGFSETLKTIIAEQDPKILISRFKDLLHLAYGKKSADGKRFMKSEEIWDEFAETEAFSDLFMELATNDASAAAFVNAIVPADMAANSDQLQLPVSDTELPDDGTLIEVKRTQAEFMKTKLSEAQFEGWVSDKKIVD